MAPHRGPAEWIGVVDEKTAWKEGVGWFGRKSGISTTVLIEAASSAASFLYEHHNYIILGTGAIVTLTTLVGLLIYRRVRIKTIELSRTYHCLAHDLRDDMDQALRQAHRGKITNDTLEWFTRRAATTIADFYRVFLDDKGINCEIYLADVDGKKEYRLLGCSHGADPGQRTWAKSIAFTDELVGHFGGEQHRGMGVVLIWNVPQAIRERWLDKTDTHAAVHVRSLMVSPINGYEKPASGEKKMLGLLFITSHNKKLQAIHVDSLKGHGDLLGMVYPVVTRPRGA